MVLQQALWHQQPIEKHSSRQPSLYRREGMSRFSWTEQEIAPHHFKDMSILPVRLARV